LVEDFNKTFRSSPSGSQSTSTEFTPSTTIRDASEGPLSGSLASAEKLPPALRQGDLLGQSDRSDRERFIFDSIIQDKREDPTESLLYYNPALDKPTPGVKVVRDWLRTVSRPKPDQYDTMSIKLRELPELFDLMVSERS
jgi:hypothetical protein